MCLDVPFSFEIVEYVSELFCALCHFFEFFVFFLTVSRDEKLEAKSDMMIVFF